MSSIIYNSLIPHMNSFLLVVFSLLNRHWLIAFALNHIRRVLCATLGNGFLGKEVVDGFDAIGSVFPNTGIVASTFSTILLLYNVGYAGIPGRIYTFSHRG